MRALVISLLPYYLFAKTHITSCTDIDIANTHATKGTRLNAVNVHPKAPDSLVKV
jgi:hypothetical protein